MKVVLGPVVRAVYYFESILEKDQHTYAYVASEFSGFAFHRHRARTGSCSIKYFGSVLNLLYISLNRTCLLNSLPSHI